MRKFLFPVILLLLFAQCKYSFRGISIPPTLKTFFVNYFDNTTDNVVATLSQDFTNRFNLKVRQETPLVENNTDPDIEFRGAITRYAVSAEAPKSDTDIAFNRINMSVRVEYINNRDPDDIKEKTFSSFRDFSPDQNLLDVQDAFIEEMNDELTEDIFQWAFTNW